MNMNNKGTRVLVMLTGSTLDERGIPEEPVKVITTGELKPTPSGGYMLRYQESQEDDTGETLTQEVLLMMQSGRVTMTRLGDFGTTMVFVKDRRFEGSYRTPYGELAMALYATQVSASLYPDHGSVHLEYQLDVQGSFAAMHTLQLEYVAEEQPC